MLLASSSDVISRLREPDTADSARIEALLEEASALVVGYLREVPHPVPDAARLVTARMVVRVLEAPEQSYSVSSTQQTAGPFSQSVTYSNGASGGAPWLTASDKTMLAVYRKQLRHGVYSMRLG